MTVSLALACLWVVVACLVAMLPSRRGHWPAWALSAVSIPLLGYATFKHGPVLGLLALFGGASVLHWLLRGRAASARRNGATNGPRGYALRPGQSEGAWSG